MKILRKLFITTFVVNLACAQQNQTDFPKLTGPYLGQNPPGNNPELFAPGIVSTSYFEHSSPVFTPDLKEIYWSTIIDENGKTVLRPTYCMKMINNVWSKPEIPFFGKDVFSCENPFISQDGKRIYFSLGSNKPQTFDLYYADRVGENWSKPVKMNDSINTSEYNESQSTIAENGTIYFVGRCEKARTGFGLFCSELENGKYRKPVFMEEKFNSLQVDWTPYIAPDESYFIFCSFREGGFGMGDLYISFKQKDGSWGEVKNMGNKINGDRNERFPNVSPDGKYLFFNSTKFITGADANSPGNGNGDVYWVSTKIIDYLRTEDLDVIGQLHNSYINEGYNEAVKKYHELEARHSEFYTFDHSVLYNLGLRLIAAQRKNEAIRILRYNSKVFGGSNTVLQNILIACLEDDKAELEEIVEQNQKEKLLPPHELNNLGYRLLNVNMIEDATRVFGLNTKLFPEEADTYDSLGEAYMKAGNKELAIVNYEKSLELNPDSKSGKDALNQLKGE